MPSILAPPWSQGQYGLHNKFQASQSYIESPFQKNKIKTKSFVYPNHYLGTINKVLFTCAIIWINYETKSMKLSKKRSHTDRCGSACLIIPGGRRKNNQFKDILGYTRVFKASQPGLQETMSPGNKNMKETIYHTIPFNIKCPE